MARCFFPYEHGYLKRSPEAFLHVHGSSGFLLLDDREINIRPCAGAGIESIFSHSWPETLASPELAALS
ncbi:hypothetical protein NY406_09165 [Chlorobaculum sp. MV4-Y]|uniref:hypothetical protein n=1 Tax=Chlorobaculum sp. MV4-Y TaxID=2976335 RepID=UPI0021B03CBE|nr:hypothetical protein [Chlorobaculum sp. MV4-Y]UWX57368.1 hypothetical protein NY406_09165 [Chlorobaculum sp. MV4-Y]